MLFNSHIFIFAFLPMVYGGFLGSRMLGGQRAALAWLFLASLVFYAWWNPQYLSLILGSIFFNYSLGRGLGRFRSRLLLSVGIVANIGALAWFKYAGFFVENMNTVFGSEYHLRNIILPLAISFFTFQQVSYLVDVFRGAKAEKDFLAYSVFVSFFPQLIAGPIVQNNEMAPQFKQEKLGLLNHRQLAVGVSIFLLGLFEKVVLADGVAVYATPVFEAAENGIAISLFEAWGCLLAYTYQIYFDFSGYSTMAIGLGWMFGLKLPINFDTPYQARSIIDFWRRWHMTLSRFLKHYVYFPLGGNRKGGVRQYSNLMITMILGGIWHGAGWNFAIWGALHGIFLIVNVAWRKWRLTKIHRTPISGLESYIGWILTFSLVVLARVFFRTTSFDAAHALLRGASGLNGAVLDERLASTLHWMEPAIVFEGTHAGYFNLYGVLWIVALSLVSWFAPSPLELFAQFQPYLKIGTRNLERSRQWLPRWQPTRKWTIAIVLVGALAIINMARVSEFIYYQF